MNKGHNTTDQTQYLTFHIAGEEYAVGILRVKEIITYGTLTTVPQTPPSIRGVINLRGSVVPIVELNLAAKQTVMGIMADSVSEVVELIADDILPAPPFGTHVSTDFLRGMGKAGAKFVLILDIDKVLAAADMIKPASPSATPAGFVSLATG